jgi:AA9 family protein
VFSADQAVYHQGPVSFYMTKVANASTADGSTPWFKIKDIGPTFSNGNAKWNMDSKT